MRTDLKDGLGEDVLPGGEPEAMCWKTTTGAMWNRFRPPDALGEVQIAGKGYLP
jgi:hypothetical protein